MTVRQSFARLVLLIAAAALVVPAPAEAGRRRGGGVSHEAIGFQLYASPQSNPIVIAPDGNLVYVASTTSNRVDIINAMTDTWSGQVPVGIEPVGLAIKPDGTELWVANHVSDSVSVIDIDPASVSYRKVVETVQSTDANGVTQFDEPVAIAFKEDGSQAYVTLSSTNQVAVVDTATYSVTAFLNIRAQEPRAMAVRNNRLYVAAFESSNQSELSACGFVGSAPQCTLFVFPDLINFATNPNLPGSTKNIVIDPDVPDRDIFVYDLTANPPTEMDVVSGVGTLLYGLAIDANNQLYVSETDARNAENGLQGQNLIDLQNRMFLNRVAKVDCNGGAGNPCTTVTQIELDAAVGTAPTPGTQLATPFGIAVSGDASTLVVTAAGSSRIATLDLGASLSGTPSTAIAGRLDVGEIPRGVALKSDGTGAPQKAYVLNTLSNDVSVVDVSNPTAPAVLATIGVGNDPTPNDVRLGRIAFNDADASTEGTFSCGSCHPDGNTDQLLWRIGGACFFGACDGHDEPRTTMPIRGLRDTLPLHWDGTLGDPFGGSNGAVGSGGSEPPDCNISNPHGCFRDLVNESLAGVMCDQAGGCATGPSGLPGQLTDAERENMATFLESVSYPPPPFRPPDDVVSSAALAGFEDFFFDQNGGGQPDTCADSNAGCHEFPLGAGTNSETLQGFDAPTMRGMTDRYLQFSLGVTAPEELLVFANTGVPQFGISPLEPSIQWDPNQGYREITTFGVAFAIFEPTYGTRPLDTFAMFEEASTGHTGALGRQVQLNTATAGDPNTDATLALLETADANGLVNLRGSGMRNGITVNISYLQGSGLYQVGGAQLSRAAMLGEAATGQLLAALTAHLRSTVTPSVAQPLISPEGANCNAGTGATGDPDLPVLNTGDTVISNLEAAHVSASDAVFVDGQLMSGASITLLGGSPVCGTEAITPDPIRIDIGTNPGVGTHLLQVRNASGLLSNELPFVVQ